MPSSAAPAGPGAHRAVADRRSAVRVAVTVGLSLLALTVLGPPPAVGATHVRNAGLEADSNSDGVPDCWQRTGYGANTYRWKRTRDAHSGSHAERLRVLSRRSGDRKLLIARDSGTCSPSVTPGGKYRIRGWYKSTAAPFIVAYVRDSSGAWHYWSSSPRLRTAKRWRHASWTTKAVPRGVTNVAFGFTLDRVGTLTADDYSLSGAGPSDATRVPSSPTTSVPLGGGATLYQWGFDSPNCSSGVWATSPWSSPGCSAAGWYTEGRYYSITDSDSPSGTNVLKEDDSGVDATGTWEAWTHDPLTAPDGSWGTEHRVDLDVKLTRWGATAQDHCSWAGGPKIFLGRQDDSYDTSVYTIEPMICDGSAHIQKKTWGTSECGKDRRAVDCTAGGTWYLLANAHPGVPSFGTWHHFTAIKDDNRDGSVTLIGLRDGVEILRYTERPGDLPNSPILRGGRDGWRSNMIDWHMDDFQVTVK